MSSEPWPSSLKTEHAMSESHRYDENVFEVEEHADKVVVKVPALGSTHEASTFEEAIQAAAEELSALQETPEGRRRMRQSGLVAAYARSVDAKREAVASSSGQTEAPAVSPLTESDFDTFVAAGPALIDFWAPWCVPCGPMERTIEQREPGYSDQRAFASVNIDTEVTLAQRCEVYSVPTVIGYVDGQEAMRIIGAVSRNSVAAELADRLGIHSPKPATIERKGAY